MLGRMAAVPFLLRGKGLVDPTVLGSLPGAATQDQRDHEGGEGQQRVVIDEEKDRQDETCGARKIQED
ncbi:hypothetical protein [Kocuria rhizophila]|uniref:hypothetical protein n=1 Tax=Kocuria rhizophila TaxID=72000 RepID=UPI0011A0F88D|nr:hypothetical protein [Kocuria rhizophila]